MLFASHFSEVSDKEGGEGDGWLPDLDDAGDPVFTSTPDEDLQGNYPDQNGSISADALNQMMEDDAKNPDDDPVESGSPAFLGHYKKGRHFQDVSGDVSSIHSSDISSVVFRLGSKDTSTQGTLGSLPTPSR